MFWTRLTTQGGLFVLGGLAALLILLANVWLAGRLTPTDGTGAVGGGTLRGWIDRLNEAAANADPGRSERTQWDRWNRSSTGETVDVTPVDLPDPVPLGRVVILIIAAFAALGVAGTVAGSWETIALWQHRVPFDPSGTPVVDPIFQRDISFFLFDLPFLRLIQTVFNGLLVATILVTGGRYLLSAMAGAAVFDTRVRVHLGVLAGLFLMSVALGYQLDKFELVHSDRGVATGVSFTDQNAQFLAYDVLTGVSAIAAAFLVGGAFARVLWPLGLTLGVWFLASLVIGRLYPAAIQQFTVVPNQFAQEEPYIANNIAMTRLAFDLNDWTERAYRGDQPLTQTEITAESDTFANARLWDYRPLGDTLDQLQTVRTYYDFVDVDTDRYLINGELRQVMLSGRELDVSKLASPGWVTQRIIYTHGIGLAMVPVNEVGSQGQPRLLISNLPPVSTGGAPPISQPRIYFGEANSSWVVVGARQPEFDYPLGTSDADVVPTSWTGTSGIRLDTTFDRLLFAIRFRDLNLLISDQVTSGSQLLFHRTLSDRLPRIAPFLKFDKDPYLVIDGAGKLKYVQDAFTTSDQFPHADPFDPNVDMPVESGLRGQDFNYIRNSVKIVTDAYDGTMTFYVADDTDPLIRAWQGVFPTVFHPLSELPADLRPHLRVPEELFDVQTRVFGRYHVRDPETFFSENDLWTVPIGTGSAQSLPPEAYYVMMRMPGADGDRVPAPPAHDPEGSPEHDRLGRRPERSRALRPDQRVPVPGRQHDLRAGPGRGPDRRRPRDQPADLAVGRGRQPGRARQPDRRAGRRLADLPPAGLPAVEELRVPGVRADRRRVADERRVGDVAHERPDPAPHRAGRQHPRAVAVARPDAGTERDPWPDRDAGRVAAAGRYSGSPRLRRRALQAGRRGTPQQRLRALRRRDGARSAGRRTGPDPGRRCATGTEHHAVMPA